ncbi:MULTISPECIES: SLC13 family permease [unclassified Wenzhouxiangella]|uniref:SLC13 family permease n=1 Tax=unclassified Wenzhouxiangella TaxID=2613841 RepID=UPI000E3281FB|nr:MULTISPECIES: SLC13 family permease [unclassified Wenzhouxiangella]RFF28389.1 SLC13 family permease [Wenzhouxiangella sp. 15181]RFP69905.1 SLC13 family permease [Wenzhouxiangella sp. 15190]
MESGLTLSGDMILVLVLLGLTITLFVTELVRLDVAAICILVLVGLLELVPGDQLFSGFASNAVIAIIAVMILGAGLDRTGVMNLVSSFIVKLGGPSESRIRSMLSATVGVTSGFMQNVGATALFMPVVSRISARLDMPLSRLLMPMGFAAIVGGTLTMVGSSPLILLNDLIETSNRSLPPGAESMQPFELFDVTLVGLALLAMTLLYFLVAGAALLPKREEKRPAAPGRTKSYFKEVYGIEGDIYEMLVTVDSPLVGMRIAEAENLEGAPLMLAIQNTDQPRLAPPAGEMIWVGTVLGVMGTREQVGEFALANNLRLQPRLRTFGSLFNPTRAGISEVVIPPGSRLVGETIGEARLRSRFGISVLAINRRNEIIAHDLREQVLQVGDCLVSHSTWRDLASLARDKDFIVATDIPKEEQRPQKVIHAVSFFGLSLFLILFTDFNLSIALMAGAIGMVLTGVLSMDEAYRAVSWKTVFLMAGLIPLGIAMEVTGTAAWLAEQVLGLLGDVPKLVVQIVLGIMATLFTLVMSNVGATVLLVPIAINIALATGGNPAVYALLIALATSNAFILPTHPVNALIMGPGGYKVKDFVRVGGIMSVLYMVVMLAGLNLVF